MKKLYFCLLTALAFITVNNVCAQVQTARYVSVTNNSHGFYEYLPQGYSTSGKTFPLLLFIHGVGEEGNGTSQLSLILRHGPPKLINNGTFPKSFTVKGVSYGFIVISPQFVSWPTQYDLESFIAYAQKNYKVDASRIYITGLSMGGGATWEYASSTPARASKVAGIVPIAGAASPNAMGAKYLANANVPIWAFHNLQDPTVSVGTTKSWIKAVNAVVPQINPLAKASYFNSTSHNAWNTAYDPNYKENGMNMYEWLLQYSRGTSAGKPPVNQSPVSNAGADKTIKLPVTSVSLTGSGSDVDGSIASYAWSKVSGPTQYTFSSTTVSSPTVSNLTLGTYVFRLTVKDNSGATGYNDVTVTVLAANKVPVASAGTDKSIQLPVSSVTLAGTGSDADGSIASYSWSKISGPTQYSFSSTTIASPTLSNLTTGTYVFRLTVKDNDGATAYDDISVIVLAANKVPVVNAGGDKSITLPLNTVSLVGTASDPDGSIASYSWSKVSGPGQFLLSSLGILTPVLSNLVAGDYVFRLTVKDNKGATAYDDVTISVKPLISKSTIAIPGTLQAEDFSTQAGVQSETTSDDGGGKNVGWIDTGDWMDFSVNVASAGSYTINYRVATSNTAQQFQLRKSDGTVLGTYTVPYTGGWQKWQTGTATVTLPAGTQTLKLYSTTQRWNLNWIKFSLVTAPATKSIQVQVYGGIAPYSNAAWNNWNVNASGNTASNVSSGKLKYTDGSVSGISAVLSYHDNMGDNTTNYGGVMAPKEVLRFTSWSMSSRTLKIAGLTAAKTYDVELYASRRKPDNSTRFTVGKTTQTIATNDNYSNKASFTKLTADAKGEITVTLASISTTTFNYLNGFTIKEYSSANAREADVLETTTAAASAESVDAVAKQVEVKNDLIGKPVLAIYPNPVKDVLNAQVKAGNTGTARVRITDAAGRVRKELTTNKAFPLLQLNIPVNELGAGAYFITVQVGDWKETKQILKL